MSWKDAGIVEKHVETVLAATVQANPGSRKELPAIVDELARVIPRDVISGPPFCIIRFVTSIKDGLDAEVGFPVRRAVDAEGTSTRRFPPLDVLSLVHTGPLETLSDSYGRLYRAAAGRGLISDEFAREVYPDWEQDEWDSVEVQFVLHDWSELFVRNLEHVLGGEAKDRVTRGLVQPRVVSSLDERFRWVRTVMERLAREASERQTYDIVSRCAHVFPQEQIEQLRQVYERACGESEDPLEAVDAVIAFMGEDPGWGSAPRREGRVVYATKAPRDPLAYQAAESAAQRRSAYCFCPIVRNRLERGMPATFCYCGAGWYRQQWEGAISGDVSIRIVKSILSGDDECRFAVRLPDDL